MKQLTDEVRDAMRMAFNLGQTYWRQADSESIKQQNKSDATREQFKALMEETVATLSAATIESKQVPDLWMNLYTVAHNLLVFIGREGSVHTESSAVNSLSNAMHDIDGGTLLDEHALAAAQQAQPEQCDHGTAWDTPCRACDDEQAQPERAPSDEQIMVIGNNHSNSDAAMTWDVWPVFARAIEAASLHQARKPEPVWSDGTTPLVEGGLISAGKVDRQIRAIMQAQPERAPLSDDEIQTIYLRTYNEGFHGRNLEIAFARAIEAAIKQGEQHE